MSVTMAWQDTNKSARLQPVEIQRRDLRADDIAVRLNFCGVCHSDLHAIQGRTIHMSDGEGLVPGHEFTGTVADFGADVFMFTLGDVVAVGTLVDSCGECAMCQIGQENFYYLGPVSTYGGEDPIDGTTTKGGYSCEYVLREKFAYHLPKELDPAAAAPLMCAGITMWEPLRAADIGAGSRAAVAGLGSLGHLGVKLATALGAEVTDLSRTAGKAGDALALGGAAGFLLTTDDDQMRQARGRFNLILDTISAEHDLLSVVENRLVTGLRIWNLPLAGRISPPPAQEVRKEPQEHSITADIELLPSSRINDALNRLEDGDVRYRFVLDMADLDQLEI